MFTPYWPATVLMLTWLAFDWKTPERGGRRFRCVRRWRLWRHYCNYFPLKLLKTHDISPSHNYILACHPHGLMSHACFGHFSTEMSGFSKIFPGITPYMLTLGAFFWVPFLREYVMATGACSVSQSSMDFLLTRRGTGNMLIVVVGGLAECRHSQPGSSTLVLKNRSGFVRMALRHGVALIPAYAFGETDLYDQHIFTPGALANRFQKWFRRMVHIYPCAFYGRGFTKNSWGFLPYTRPVTTVVGEPLPLPKIENPSQETVAKYHALYIDALRKLFDEHKTKFGISETQELVII
nr:acyl-CoA wax alcohol acyltransferase 2 isoform X2 [Microcebus murinus]XP_012591698.1 acyl-CoA wax alcohol acyltransferase 2 isoform X2 [Microcebus murinus]XP_012591699.1 acyl-CoA wax alcohol acyltransferase 2 isoform X2 [Microcebus murinus]XP_012591700.1 acyl-CoA wax alcohol acyltransferase 2 isoform X2 [Microcebus murinus]XP_020140704.1 acyl-CoA wax alcohol acyltransferase 2 isoform X2 [Microcebus murinus]XP_020140705.1 acyl-CoA wax alcohol acyltransferase 2 isoform X2 [Microcebus murinus]